MCRHRATAVLFALAALVVDSPAGAATKNWNANIESGNWSTAANWSPSGVPGDGDDANITLSVLLAKYTINYDSTAEVALNSLTLSQIGAGGSSLTMNMSGSNDVLYTNYEYLAVNSPNAQNAAFNQSDGENISDGLFLGYGQNGTGTYNLTGGTLQINSALFVGYNGVGYFNQSGGIDDASVAELYVAGNSASSPGTYTLSGGKLYGGEELIGPAGTFQHSAGENDAGQIDVEGGTYTVNGSTAVVNTGSIVVGSQLTGGAFNQSASTVGSSDNPLKIEIGVRSGSSGTYTLSGTGQIVASEEDIGEIGSGTFNQTAGANNISGKLLLGVDASDFSTAGSYNLSGGADGQWR